MDSIQKDIERLKLLGLSKPNSKMKNKYDLNVLIKTFKEHAENNDALRKIAIESNPDCEWVKDEFNLSEALGAICQEIKDLKDWKYFQKSDSM